jgi:hypothetical protein
MKPLEMLAVLLLRRSAVCHACRAVLGSERMMTPPTMACYVIFRTSLPAFKNHDAQVPLQRQPCYCFRFSLVRVLGTLVPPFYNF